MQNAEGIKLWRPRMRSSRWNNMHHCMTTLSEVSKLPEIWQQLHFQLCASYIPDVFVSFGNFVRFRWIQWFICSTWQALHMATLSLFWQLSQPQFAHNRKWRLWCGEVATWQACHFAKMMHIIPPNAPFPFLCSNLKLEWAEFELELVLLLALKDRHFWYFKSPQNHSRNLGPNYSQGGGDGHERRCSDI